jgi:hypothetical protein
MIWSYTPCEVVWFLRSLGPVTTIAYNDWNPSGKNETLPSSLEGFISGTQVLIRKSITDADQTMGTVVIYVTLDWTYISSSH